MEITRADLQNLETNIIKAIDHRMDQRLADAKDEIVQVLDQRIDQRLADTKKELVELLDQRLDDKFKINNDIIRQEIKASEARVISSVSNMLGENVLPQIDNLDERITVLETRTDVTRSRS